MLLFRVAVHTIHEKTRRIPGESLSCLLETVQIGAEKCNLGHPARSSEQGGRVVAWWSCGQ
jgi:hypothetical protein